MTMSEKCDDLGLSLSLACPDKCHAPLSNLMHHHQQNRRTTFKQLFQSSDTNSKTSKDETRIQLRGIDVNRVPTAAAGDGDDDAGVSSPKSTVSSSLGMSEEDDGGVGGGEGTARKKLRLSKDQAAVLEESFKEHNTLNPKQKVVLAKRLNLMPRQVEVWFQNRRARTKLKQTEVDCEYLRRCCENLTDENRRLQKEVQELRALKLSPHINYMHMPPPTTLTMCPSCDLLALSSSSSSAAAAAAAATTASALAKTTNGDAHRHRHHRPTPVRPWTRAPVQHRSLDAFAPRS